MLQRQNSWQVFSAALVALYLPLLSGPTVSECHLNILRQGVDLNPDHYDIDNDQDDFEK